MGKGKGIRGQAIVEYLAVAVAILVVILTFVAPRMGARYELLMGNLIDRMPVDDGG